MSLPIASTKTERLTTMNPWALSDRALTVFYGCPELPRLSHYFLPRLLFAKKQILYLDGANQISPLLLARFARERGLDPSSVNSLIRVGLFHYSTIVDQYIEVQKTLTGSILPPMRFLYIFSAYVWHLLFGSEALAALKLPPTPSIASEIARVV